MDERRAERFLELYRRLEEALKQRGFRNGRSSVVMQFMNTREGSAFKEELNTCREMRNILSHSPDINGDPPLIPSQGAMEALEEAVRYLEHPPLALEFAAKGQSLITVGLETAVCGLMKTMRKTGYSHIPVLEDGRLMGVFSISTLFSHVLDWQSVNLELTTPLRDFADYLPVDRHVCESFAFAPPEATVHEAELLLENKGGPKQKRPAALFITSDGTPEGELLGMVTPWDLLGKTGEA